MSGAPTAAGRGLMRTGEMLPPIASIVVPAHNAGNYIDECLRSLRRQSFDRLEIIVVDDGSTDATASIVRGHAAVDPRIKLLQQPASGTPASPRNRGIAAATGDVVFLFDADDVAHPDKVQVTLDALRTAPSDTALAITDFTVFLGATTEATDKGYLSNFGRIVSAPDGESRGHLLLSPIEAYDLLLDGNFVGTSAAAIRRSVLARAGSFDESLRYSEDYDLWLRLVQVGALLVVNRPLHFYRSHDAGLSKRGDSYLAPFRIRVLEKQFANRLSKAQIQRLRRRIAENYSGIGWENRKRHQYRAACLAELRAFSYRPTLSSLRGVILSALMGFAGAMCIVRRPPAGKL
jgi:glycosyltransferase involved in cell wall biosynthesis